MEEKNRKFYKVKAMRALIAEAVIAVLNREGSQKASVDLIAREAGLSKGGVFYYYPTKTKLLLSVLDEYLENFHARRAEIMLELPDTRENYVKATFTVLFEVADLERDDQLYVAKLLDVPGFCEALAKIKSYVLNDMREGVKNTDNVLLACVLYEGLWGDSLLRPHSVFRQNTDLIKSKIWELLDSLEYEENPTNKNGATEESYCVLNNS